MSEQRVRPATGEVREERKVLSALFADLTGSTALAERLDPEEVRLVVADAIARIVAVVEELGGYVKDLAGDGVLAFFGAPITSEDDAERARIAFTLREADRVTVTIVDVDGDDVETIADAEPHAAGPVEVEWGGEGAPEGVYRARVRLAEQRRTIVIPNPMRLDRTPPQIVVESVEPRTFSPDGDGRADRVRVAYTVSERSRVQLLVDGEPAVETPLRGDAKLEWYGRGLRPATYGLSLVAEDAAGNRSQPTTPVAVRLRFVDLSPERVVVPVGARFGVRVSTDVERYTWRLGARTGTASGDTLELRAPQQEGRYTLRVGYGEHEAAIPVFVRPRP